MLRSLYAGISGLRSHQTMLDVTGNNIANVNTVGFKAGSVQFQDTLSQIVQNSRTPQADAGGTNAAQVGLGTQVAGIRTNFTQGSRQATGVATDLMIAGDGFFVVRNGAETLYTRNGAFSFDASGRMVSADGARVQGWTATDGVITTGSPVGDISLPVGATSPAQATGSASVKGNLPSDAAVGEQLVRDITVYDAQGSARQLALTFTRTGAGWDVTDGVATTSLAFADGKPTSAASITSGGVAVDLSEVTGFADLRTVALTGQDGRAPGSLVSYTISSDGSLIGSFSNGASDVLAQVALAAFDNPEGLEKTGSSQYRAGANSGAPAVGAAGADGFGDLASGSLEMSNVDLSQEFTNLIVAQRGFQANARIITTSDEVLQELTNLKR
ncbi:flagellar hook protein FlgE [Microbacterium sp. zg.Y909]|uniref:flagellar hook protein FlgE n=1 Tax=Microbacterium sp. zg.Y909 TaxID=2969413 RepID=UPI00214B36C2|nr:flagellar hook protein FlgE [Microbacterium sp. zg.Y909]MCR2824529.1 flagellar hook protein FlgE [Microbacterium sp. zg.Y909]